MMSTGKCVKKHFWDCENAVTHITPRFMLVSEVLSTLIFVSSCAVLLGWALDITVLKSALPGLVTMKANTAFCFALLGASLWLLQFKRKDNPRLQTMAGACSFVVFGIGLLTILEYLLGRNFGMDQILFKEAPGAILTSSPGRMAINTAIDFTIAGAALSLLALKSKNCCLLTHTLMIPVGVTSALAGMGYLYHAEPLFIGSHFSTAMALHTMILFLAVFGGTLFCRPGCGLMTVVSSETAGGKLIRRLFPVTVLVPLILGWIKLHVEKGGWIGNAFGVAFVAIGNMTITTLCVYLLSLLIDKKDAERERAAEAQEEAQKSLHMMINSIPDVFYVLSEDGKFLLWNKAFETMSGYSREEIFKMQVTDFFDKEGAVNMANAIKGAFEKGFNVAEESFLTKGGRKIPMLYSGSVTKDFSGRTVLCGVGKDITEHKKMQALRERLSFIIEGTPDFVGFADAKDQRILYINKAGRKMIGVGEDEDLTKLRISDVHPVQMNKKLSEEILPTVIRDGLWKGEGAFLNLRDGREIPVLMVIIGQKAPNGEIETISTISRDITEWKQAEAENQRILGELQVFYKASMGREARVMELRAEVDQLKKELGR